jgi:hypothetical protein
MICTTPATRVCRRCGDDLPIECFRRNRKGSEEREYHCNRCHNLNSNERHARRRARDLKRFAKSCQFQKLDRRLRAFTIAMMTKLGGFERLINSWAAAIRAAEKRNPGCPFLLNSFSSMFRLLEFCAAHPEPAVVEDDLAAVTAAGAEEIMRREVLSFVQRRPEVAVAAAQALGWTVIPPPEVTRQT